MTLFSATDVVWFLQTAGVTAADGYRWLPVGAAGSPETADTVLDSLLGRHTVRSLTSPNEPSIVFARTPDGGFVLVANRMPAPGPPRQDYRGRAISVTLLGVCPPGADPVPLTNAAAAAFAGDLALWLPVRWTQDGTPQVDLSAGRWPPAADGPQAVGSPAVGCGPDRRFMVPPSAAGDVAAALAALSADDLARFPADRVLALRNPDLPIEALRELKPWRAVTPAVKGQVMIEDSKSWFDRLSQVVSAAFRSPRRLAVGAIGVLVVLAVAWAVRSLHR